VKRGSNFRFWITLWRRVERSRTVKTSNRDKTRYLRGSIKVDLLHGNAELLLFEAIVFGVICTREGVLIY
ncbi:hypothetical protein LINPERHAP2_LOCUS16914, partial [Linum perenne]